MTNDKKLVMEPLVKQLSIGLKRETSASKPLLIAIRLGEQPKNAWPGTRTALAKSLVMSRCPFDAELDARQLACPMPILLTKKSLSQLVSGQVLRIVATDKESPKDFAVFCRQTGNELLSSSEKDGEFVFYLRRR